MLSDIWLEDRDEALPEPDADGGEVDFYLGEPLNVERIQSEIERHLALLKVATKNGDMAEMTHLDFVLQALHQRLARG